MSGDDRDGRSCERRDQRFLDHCSGARPRVVLQRRHVSLRLGKTAILAQATNVAGNAGSSEIVITRKLPLCKVPKLYGKTLNAARKALRHSHCSVGKLERVHSRRIGKGRIVTTKPRAGTTHRRGYKVRLTVSRGR